MAASDNQFMWYELQTKGIDDGLAFYKALFGWTSEVWEGGEGAYHMLKLNNEPFGGAMEIPAEAVAMGAPPNWSAYVGVSDVDAATQKAEGLGARTVVPPTDIPNAGRFSVIADPQGAVIALYQPDTEEPEMSDGRGVPGRVAWHELITSDMEAGFSFYQAMFGWQKGEAIDTGGMGTYQLFSVAGGEPVGGMMNLPPDMPASAWMYYFAVADLDAALAKVTELGGKSLCPPMEVPGGIRVAPCMDPQGAVFALHYMPA